MAGSQLEFDLGDVNGAAYGALTRSADAMIENLKADGRLSVDHLPLVALLHKLASALEQSGGRGASVALLSAQFREVWKTLSEIPTPIDESAMPEFDVVLLPVVADAS